MRVPYSWLREYCDPGLSAGGIGARLALTGTEVDRVAVVGLADPSGFVVGAVLAVDAHPDADRLRVCRVDVGEDEPRTIVCGAANVAAGQSVPVALPGAVLPAGQRIEQAELRGVSSSGMICSQAELGLGADAEGIMVLAPSDGAPAPGTALGEVLAVSDEVLELDVTPNRVDCLGVYGVAREVHAVTGAPLAAAPWEQDAEPSGERPAGELASVRVEVPELCPRFTARVFEEVRIGPSPDWLQQRLIAAGQRPINNVVDITNYVMLLTAQPLHAFDLDLVPGGELIVRRAADGETMTTLDGVERHFDGDAVLVCDRNGPTGIAGIMGGQVSEVSGSTTRVLLEVATWDGVNILRTSSRLGLRSEASTRFEKQLHPEIATRAQRIASRLLVELAGARMAPGTIDELAFDPAPRRLRLRPARSDTLLGERIAPADQAAYLERLGIGVTGDDDELAIEVPFHRHFDLTREVDLIEEVARVHGLDKLPATLPRGARVGGLSREQRLRRRAEDLLVGLGFDEVKAWSFVDPGESDRLRLGDGDPRRGRVAIANPLSEEQSLMRTMLLGGLLATARTNLSRGAGALKLFESGRVYLRAGEPRPPGLELAGDFPGEGPAPALEPHRLGALLVGSGPGGWRDAESPLDFHVAKGAVEALASGLGAEVDVATAEEPFLRPGRAAHVAVAGSPCGWVGELHPLLCREYELDRAAAFELDLAPLVAQATAGGETYTDITTFPAVYEDIAVLADRDLDAARVRAAIVDAGGELLRSAEIFDVYEGDQLGPGRRSLALRLEYRAADRTLTDAEVAQRRERIVAELERIGAELRG